MVEITVNITDRDDNSLDVVIRGAIYQPSSGYEKEVGRALVPMLNDLLMKIKEQFPTQTIRIAEFESPLNPSKTKPNEPWKFPGRS